MNPSILVNELIRRGLVTHAVVEDLLQTGTHSGKAIEIALIDEGLVKEEVMLKIMSELFDIPFQHIAPEDLDNRLAETVPRKLLSNFCVYPLLRKHNSDSTPLATIDPFDVTAADVFRQVTGREVNYILVPKAEIQAAIQGKLVDHREFGSLVELVPTSGEPELGQLESLLEADATVLSENSSPIIKLVNSILREAIRLKASDIHIEPQEKDFRIRYRIDGILKTIAVLPKRAEKTCVSRMKILADIDISETRKAQDGRISLTFLNGRVNMRVSTVPSAFGEKVVLRLLDQSATKLELEQLGLSEIDLNTLHRHLASSSGMILITGPTGSGKTSTLYAGLRLLNSPSVNIVTVEDPVEYQLEGLTQVQVNPRAGLTFASSLRAFLRQDPDIIMVGEIRDLETAQTAIQAAQSGHLVLSTLHTNSSPATLSRLVLLGVKPHHLAGGLSCVIAQRLVRKICSGCKTGVPIKPEERTLLQISEEDRVPSALFQGQGCKKCDGTGFKGRVGLYELLTMTSPLREQMVLDPTEEALWRVARNEGMKTLLEDGLDKVEQGLTTLGEVLRVVTIRRRGVKSEANDSYPSVVSPPQTPRTVAEVMVKNVATLHPKAALSEAVSFLTYRGITGCPVVDHQGRVIGLVSHWDLSSVLRDGATAQVLVEDIMSQEIISVDPQESVQSAVQKMWRYRIHRVLVIDGEALVGILTPFDLMLHSSLF